jgi:amidase
MIKMSIYAMQQQLIQGKTTSVALVQQALQMHQKWLSKNAIACISPLALTQAKKADEERTRGYLRGPLHGIPIVIKDNILYSDGTPTTANSFALKDFYPQSNATLVTYLIDAGAIILGKANLSEFAYFMGDEKTPSGYGSMYGQVKHPTNETIDPYGSSTGSAVAVALDIVPFAIGTETNGSLMAPAYQCQIVAFKPTTGMISRHGIIPISPTQDTAGPMAKTVYDCAVAMDILSEVDPQDPLTKTIVRPASFIEFVLRKPNKKRIAWLNIIGHPYDEIDRNIIQNTQAKMIQLGHEVLSFDIALPPLDNYSTLLYEFKHALNQFLHQFNGQGAPHALTEIIAFNQQHAARCLKYGQDTLILAEAKPDYDENYQQIKKQLLLEASQLQNLMITQQLDAVFAPTWLGFAPIFGNPSLCLPQGYFQEKPKAIVLVGRLGHDQELLQLGYHFYDQHVLKV